MAISSVDVCTSGKFPHRAAEATHFWLLPKADKKARANRSKVVLPCLNKPCAAAVRVGCVGIARQVLFNASQQGDSCEIRMHVPAFGKVTVTHWYEAGLSPVASSVPEGADFGLGALAKEPGGREQRLYCCLEAGYSMTQKNGFYCFARKGSTL